MHAEEIDLRQVAPLITDVSLPYPLPALLVFLVGGQGLLIGNTEQDAREIVSHLACAACHDARELNLEKPARGPILDGVGSRVKAGWIERFLLGPQSVKPGTSMPDMLAHLEDSQRKETAKNLMHFLMSSKGTKAKPHRHADPDGGAHLYRTIGCAACHGAKAPDLRTKYTFASLTDFLLDPLASRPDGRMPSLQLTKDEAADMAAHLLRMRPDSPKREMAPPFEPHPQRVAAGRTAFARLNCAACHSRGDTPPAPLIGPWHEPNPIQCAGPPHYTLTEEQEAVLETEWSDQPSTSHLRLGRHLRRFQCLACHDRVGAGGPSEDSLAFFTGDDSLGNDGRFPPSLTNVGAKLNPDWMVKVLQGDGAVRPYLNTRMPVFGIENVGHLPDLFTQVDQPHKTPPLSDEVDAGHQLAGTEGGMGCITCHGWHDDPGVTLHALKLTDMVPRLRFSWFKQHLIDPQRTRTNTLMPSFWPQGKSGNPHVLDGDTDRQIAAIWAYLRTSEKRPDGFPNPGSSEYEIVPTEKAIVQRGFIDGGGTSAIAVGFPGQWNLLYNADLCRPVRAWRGRFLDGYPLWFSRLKPETKPLDDTIHELPDVLTTIGNRVYKGYRLDPDSGVPAFLSQTNRYTIQERMFPSDDGLRLKREILLKDREHDTEEKLTFEYQW